MILNKAKNHALTKAAKTLLFTLLALLLGFFAVEAALAQSPTLDYSGRIDDRRPELLDQRLKDTSPGIELPPPPQDLQSTPQPDLKKTVYVRTIQVEGVSVFSADQISQVTASYLDRDLSMTDLETLRRELTLLYVNQGYVNSGAIIPSQTISDGQLLINVIEGRLATIQIEEGGRFAASYLKKRAALGTTTPLNIATLQKRLQLLQQDSRIDKVQANLKPGVRLGDAELNLKVVERPALSWRLAVNNYQSPTIGEDRGMTTIEHRNLTGHGDILKITAGMSEGLNHLVDTSYSLPINAYDTTLQIRYWNNDQTVVDDQFGPLDIESEEQGYSFGFRHPLFRSLDQEFALSLEIEKSTNKNFLLGYPFSFSPGEVDGVYRVAPLRFGQEWIKRSQEQVIAMRSRFSFGLDAFNATVHDGGENLPDGTFISWLGQAQYAQILGKWNIQLLARLDLQLARDPLFPSEQIGVGGRYSVRGYRENQIVADKAVIGSIETRIPFFREARWADTLQFCQFFDFGKSDNVDAATPEPDDIASVGLGLRWGKRIARLPFNLQADAELYWGHQLRDIDSGDEGLQDDGIHYQISVTGYF